MTFDTTVARITGQKTVIVSSDNTNFKYVVVRNNDNTIQKLTTGQRVKINGKKSPTPATADMSSNWQLAASEIVAAQQYDYFIDAQQIQIVLD